MATVKDLVLHHLTYTFEKDAWQWPLSSAVSGLTAEQASWKPGPERHSIWQIVQHLTRWKEGVLGALEGTPRSYREITAEAWPEAHGDQTAWEGDVDRLSRVSLQLKARVEAMDDRELSRELPWYAGAAPRPIDQRFLDMATHDIYHTGQIQYIRALQEVPIDMFFNAVGDSDIARVRRVLEAHPELIHAYDPAGFTGVQLAAWKGDRAMVEFLLDRGADVEAVSRNEMRASAIRVAEERKHPEIAALLRQRTAARPRP